MLLNTDSDLSQCPGGQNQAGPESGGLVRVICTNSEEHSRVSSLRRMGLSLQAVAAITGLAKKELKRFQ